MADFAECDALVSALQVSRQHVLTQVTDLPERHRRQSVAPSGWSPIGLVRHLTLADERYWFEVVVAGGPLDFWPEQPNGDWIVRADESTDEVLAAYVAAIESSNRIIAATPLDTAPRCPEPEQNVGIDLRNLRAILLHSIVETSTHAGHLDVARELIDGHQHIVL